MAYRGEQEQEHGHVEEGGLDLAGHGVLGDEVLGLQRQHGDEEEHQQLQRGCITSENRHMEVVITTEKMAGRQEVSENGLVPW